MRCSVCDKDLMTAQAWTLYVPVTNPTTALITCSENCEPSCDRDHYEVGCIRDPVSRSSIRGGASEYVVTFPSYDDFQTLDDFVPTTTPVTLRDDRDRTKVVIPKMRSEIGRVMIIEPPDEYQAAEFFDEDGEYLGPDNWGIGVSLTPDGPVWFADPGGSR